MPRLIFAMPLVMFGALAGCAELPSSPNAATRLDTSPLVFQNRAQDAAYLQEQADTLTQMAKDLRRKSTLRGATIGAVVGCGIGVLSASGAERCLVGAAAGGVIGAVTGHEAGKRDVAKRLDTATPDNLLRSLRTTQDHMIQIQKTLPHVMAEQDTTLAALQVDLANGRISQARYEDGVATIRNDRARIAEALTLSGKQLRASRENVENAVGRGQIGLDRHLKATKSLEEDVYSARSGITLL
mmetsp:Transcript_22546/g.36637  ORF Transcript_22546/g.36637 Transcript_22546/m.36637 type:complete len:242 (-) Transcript_22546:951-1676(-)